MRPLLSGDGISPNNLTEPKTEQFLAGGYNLVTEEKES
jgi:hypothetical protein